MHHPSLSRHQLYECFKQGTLICVHCSHIFKHKQHLKRHVQNVHNIIVTTENIEQYCIIE